MNLFLFPPRDADGLLLKDSSKLESAVAALKMLKECYRDAGIPPHKPTRGAHKLKAAKAERNAFHLPFHLSK